MCDQCVEWGGHAWHSYNGGYYERSEKRKGVKTSYRLHREVYREHHGVVPDGHDVHHVNHDKTDNSVGNLLAVTRSEHRKLHGPPPRADWAIRPTFDVDCEDCGATVQRKRKGPVVCQRCQHRRADKKRTLPRKCRECGADFKSIAGNFCSQRCVNLATHGATESVLLDG